MVDAQFVLTTKLTRKPPTLSLRINYTTLAIWPKIVDRQPFSGLDGRVGYGAIPMIRISWLNLS